MDTIKIFADAAQINVRESDSRRAEVIYEFNLRTKKVYKHWGKAVTDYYYSKPGSSINNIPCVRFGDSILIKEYVFQWILTNLNRKIPFNWGF